MSNAKCSKCFQCSCNNSDRTWFFNVLTFARSLGRCWKPRPSVLVFNTSLGTWRMLLHESRRILTLEGSGLSGNREALRRNASGAGLPRSTSGSEPHITKWSNKSKNSLWLIDFSLKLLSLEPVTTARGILCLCRWRTSLSAPEIIFNSYLLVSNVYVRCLTSLSAPENILNS